MHGTLRLPIAIVLVAWWATVAAAQTVTVVHNVNLRPDPSSEYPPTRLLLPSEPPLTLLEPSRSSTRPRARRIIKPTACVTRPTVTPMAGCKSIPSSQTCSTRGTRQMKEGISCSRSCATTPSHSRMRSLRAQASRTTRRSRRSALMSRSRGHSCGRRITRSGTRFIRSRVSRCSKEIRLGMSHQSTAARSYTRRNSSERPRPPSNLTITYSCFASCERR